MHLVNSWTNKLLRILIRSSCRQWATGGGLICLGSLGERESEDKKDKPWSPTLPFLQATQAE